MSARAAALRALADLERGRVQRLEQSLRLDDLEPRDRALCVELARGTERWHLQLDYALRPFTDKGLPEDPLVLSVLRLGAYQLLHLRGVPARAAVNETVALAPQHGRGFVNAVLRAMQRRIAGEPRETSAVTEAAPTSDPAPADSRPDDGTNLELPGGRWLELPDPRQGAAHLAAQFGLPEFLVERWLDTHGADQTRQVCEASAARPRLLAWNLDTGDAKALESRGAGEMLPAPWMVQGEAARQAALAMPVEPGELVLDLCAAPGAKTMVLAKRVGPEGLVLAFDVDEWRRQLVGQAAERLGLLDCVALLDDPGALLHPPDHVLVDVPCSNTGVLNRRVEVRRRLRPSTMGELAAIQEELLRQAIRICRAGGTVTYSTCSLEPEENQAVVEAAIMTCGADGIGVSLAGQELTLPRLVDGVGSDGGYWALLRKAEGSP